MPRAESGPSQPIIHLPGSSDLESLSPDPDSKSEKNPPPSTFKHRTVEKSDSENKVSNNPASNKGKKSSSDTPLQQRPAKQLSDKPSYAGQRHEKDESTKNAEINPVSDGNQSNSNTKLTEHHEVKALSVENEGDRKHPTIAPLSHDSAVAKEEVYDIETDSGSLKIHIPDLKQGSTLDNRKGSKLDLFQEESAEIDKPDQEIEWDDFEKSIKSKKPEDLIKHFKSAIRKFTHIRSLLSAARLLNTHNSTSLPLGLTEKQVKDLQKRSGKEIENRLQGHLRDKLANTKKTLRPLHVILDKKKKVKQKSEDKNWENTRYQKELQQTEIAIREIELDQRYSATKTANNLNSIFSTQKASSERVGTAEFSQSLHRFLALSESEAFNPVTTMDRKYTYQVMDKQLYLEKVIYPKIDNYCSSVIDNCMEEAAIKHVANIISQMASEGKIPEDIAHSNIEKAERQLIELEIFKSKKSSKKMEEVWTKLPKPRKKSINNSLNNAANIYSLHEKDYKNKELLYQNAFNSFKKAHEKYKTASGDNNKKRAFEVLIKTKKLYDQLKQELEAKELPVEALEKNVKQLLLEEFEHEIKKLPPRFSSSYGDTETLLRIALNQKGKNPIKKIVSEEDKALLTQGLENVKSRINHASNQLYINNKAYRQKMSFYVKNELKRKHQTQFETTSLPFYRAVGSNPQTIFNTGFMPALLSRLSYQKGLLNQPYINDSAVTDKNVGWTGGIVSLSDNFLHSAEGIYTSTTGQKQTSRWVYLVLPDETADVSQHLHKGADPVAMDAREVIATCVPKKQIIAARESKADGSLGPIVWNTDSSTDRSFNGNNDLAHFLTAKHLSEVEQQDPTREFNKFPLSTSDKTNDSDLSGTDAEKDRAKDYKAAIDEEKARLADPFKKLRWEMKLAETKEQRFEMYMKSKGV